MEFRILGPLEVHAAGRAVAVPGAKPRAVLAVLLLNANQSVSAEQLALALWGEEAPESAVNTVQVHMSRLRKALGDAGALVTTPAGYRLQVEPDALDAARFERGLAAGRRELAAGRAADAATLLEDALSLWRGRPLEDLAYEPFAQGEIARLEEARMAAYELLVDAQLELGRHAEVVGELETAIADHPYRERLRAQLMLALYRCERQADALQAYQDARRRLSGELGIEPGERLRELERAILAQDPALAAPAGERTPGPAVPAVAEAPARRLVSVVFAGAPGLAARLDAESMHGVLDAYSAVIERHGGTVEGVIGDAMVGLFGKVAVHEDDALRAVRAASELRDLNVGVEAGEVFVGAGRRFATGDVFNVAARLQDAAPEGGILLGEHVHRLVAHAVRAEPAAQAWRLLDLEPADAPATPLVGRRAELEALNQAFATAATARGCRAVTVVGPAGIGKSRLAREFAAAIAADATVVFGHCPSYGEGLTHRPLAEIFVALGESDPPATQPEELFWAVRRMFERAAEERPLVVVVEDIHWAEPTLLDLLDYLVAFVSGHPVLLVCLTRPELAETRPGWTAPQPNRTLIALEPLPVDEARRLVAHAGRVDDATAARIVAAAEGNPLFLEQLVAVGDEAGLPSTIQAVLAARIDRLEPGERAVLEQASVQGRSFYVGALADDAPVHGRLVALVGKQLIRAERSELPGEDAFAFAHVLIREAAYRGLPKQRRAELHEAAARWLDAQPGAPDEAVGHHLAAAYRYREELGETEHALAGEAAERLAAAADSALARGDPAAGARLLEQAAALLDWYPAARAEVLPALGAALFEAGRMADATHVLDEAIAAAPEPRLRARAQIERALVRLETETGAGTGEAQTVADAALEALDGDDDGQPRLWLLRGRIVWSRGAAADADAAWRQAAESAARTGARRDVVALIGWRALAAALGPLAVDEAIRRCHEYRNLAGGSPVAIASTLNPLALLHAMKGDFGGAEQLLARAGEIGRELGGRHSGVSHLAASVRLLAGQPELAEAPLRADLETLRSLGEHETLATTAALLAQAVRAQGRFDEAAELCRLADRHAPLEDIATHVIWRGVAATALARQRRAAEAEALAREAVALVERTDLLSHHGDAMLDLAEVLRMCDRADDAEQATRAGIALYERKGNRAAAARARSLSPDRSGG